MATQPQAQPQAASPPTSLTICDTELGRALGALRATPAAELAAVRALRIDLTESNLLHWHGSLWPGAHAVFDDEDLEECARLYPAPASSVPREAFRALLRFVAGSLDLGRLELEVEAGGAAWSLFSGRGAAAYATQDEVNEGWRFVYEFYLDVRRAVAEVFSGAELRRLDVQTIDLGWDERVTGAAA